MSEPLPAGASAAPNRSLTADLRIRAYDEADEEQVLALWAACDLTRPWNDPGKDIARKLTVQRELFLVAELGGSLVGSAMAGYDGHRGWVNYLAVHPRQQGQGIGRALMHTLEQGLLAVGCPKINLQVRASNEKARHFYHALGYAQDEVVSLGKRLIVDSPGST